MILRDFSICQRRSNNYFPGPSNATQISVSHVFCTSCVICARFPENVRFIEKCSNCVGDPCQLALTEADPPHPPTLCALLRSHHLKVGDSVFEPSVKIALVFQQAPADTSPPYEVTSIQPSDHSACLSNEVLIGPASPTWAAGDVLHISP